MMHLQIKAESDHSEKPLCELIAMLDELAVKLGEDLDAGRLQAPFNETYYATSGEISISIELEPDPVREHPGALALED